MSKELVIGSNRHETKVAVLEDDQLTEIFFQRENEYSLAGSIHKGRVTRVLPGMQSAFVDLGLERDTFLYVSDFFEEHDDIDTVVEDKPARGERRDRNPVRSMDRPSGAPSGITSVAPTVALQEVSDAVTPDESEDNVQDEPASQIGESPVTREAPKPFAVRTNTEQPEQRSGERPEGDRNFRGDRRGGRSRRRRSRGQGIPENKYAQPGSTSTPAPVRELISSVPRSRPEEQEESEPLEAIVLPGESLAKYRRVSAAPESEPVEPSAQPPAPEPGFETDLDEEHDLEAEAQELELVEKIFSHHDDESVSEVEEKIEEVRQDQPPSPFVVDDIDAEEPLGQDEAEQPRGDAEHSSPHTASAEVRSGSTVEPLRTSFEYSPEQSLIAEYSDIESIEVSFPGEVPETEGLSAAERAEDEVGEAATFGEDIEGADIEDVADVEGGAEAPGSGESAANPEETPGLVQTASVRDPGERSMHRTSRRMRRRRGGSRFSQQSGDAVSNETVSAPASGAATATAVVTQPAARNEQRSETREERSTEKPERVLPSISELLKAGQEIIVQIAKEPLGQKGARITSHIALPGRYVVFMPSVAHLGVSRKIASDEERQRLKHILQAHRAGTTGGFIVRTAGEGIPEDEIAADMDFLYKLWLDIRQKAEKKPAPMLLHYDLDIVQRILRDQVTEDFKAIWVDNEEMYEHVLSFTQRFQPALVSRVKMYTRAAPIFDAFGITQELEKALRPKVWLKSGGYIVINQTEALVAIDINTGKYVGKSNRLEDTIVKTNIEAVKEIVRQIRLRDLGGIIVVDFIDMDERKNRQKVMQVLEEAMQADKAPYKILQFNDFGLVAITRKRVKQSLERTLCAPCPYCEGAGYVKSVQTIIGEILIEAQKIARAIEGKDVMLRVHPDVAKVLKGNDNKYLEELEEILGRPVLVKGDPALHHEKFDLG